MYVYIKRLLFSPAHAHTALFLFFGGGGRGCGGRGRADWHCGQSRRLEDYCFDVARLCLCVCHMLSAARQPVQTVCVCVCV